MYLSIGGDMAVRDRAVIGIFDLDNTTYSKRTRELLRRAEELGGVTCFAYPFGCSDPDAKALVDELFPVTLMTTPKCADLAKGPHDLPRFTVTMKTDLEKLLR